MIEQIYQKPAAIEQHRGAPVIGPYLDRIVEPLVRQGYKPRTVRRYVSVCEEFGRFLVERDVPLSAVKEAHIEGFLEHVADHTEWLGAPVDASSAVRKRRAPVTFLWSLLREEGVVEQSGADVPGDEDSEKDVLVGYVAFLRRVRGIQESSIGQHRLHVSRFLRHIGGGADFVHRVTASQIDGFLTEWGQRLSRRSIGSVSTALRGFFRYLHLTGQIDQDLSSQVATPRIYEFETVPRSISWADVLKVLATPDRSTVVGRRDYAMLVLLVVYGLRAAEVAALSLEDIDWRADRLRISRAKGGDASWFPLHTEVGEAISNYLRHGRPRAPHCQVFLTVRAPVRPFPRGAPVGLVVRRHLQRAGVNAPHWGSHTLRHSRAVQLLQQGFSLMSIGDFLGHRRPQSTFIYTKAALDDLRTVALEVTEVLP